MTARYSSSSAGAKRVPRAGPLVRAAAAVALVAFVVAFTWRSIDIPTAQQWAFIVTPNNLWRSAALFVCIALSVVTRGLRWAVLLKGVPIARSMLVAGFAWCFLVIQSIPFRGGEPYRILWVKSRGGSATHATTVAVLDRLIDSIAVCIVIAVALVMQPALTGLIGWTTVMLVLAAAMLGLLGAAFVAPWLLRRLGPTFGGSRLAPVMEKSLNSLAAALGGNRALPVALLTFASWTLMGLGYNYYLAATADATAATAFAVLALVNLSGVLALAPANIGVFEAVTVATLVASGSTADRALVVAIGLHIVVVSAQAVAGVAGRLALLARERR